MYIRNDYMEKLKNQIDEWDLELEKLENTKLQKLNGDVKANADKQISLIRSQRDELKMNIAKIQNSTDNDWEELKKRAEDVKEKISRTFSEARSELK
jgi:gas vesicle protein